jgi:hypothetical protein
MKLRADLHSPDSREKMPKKIDLGTQNLAVSNIPRVSPVQDVFGWTVPVEQIPLPSGGGIYPAGSALHGVTSVQIKAMTAQEEDILLSRALAKEGTVVASLVKSCLIDKSIDPGEMLIGDRTAILVAIRITGYGSAYNAVATCPACARQGSYTFDLSDLAIKRLGTNPVAPGQNEFEFSLPVSKKRVTFKLMTANDEEEATRARERMAKLFPDAKIEGTVTKSLENQLLSIDGKTDKNAISAFIRAMPAADSRALRQHMAAIEPGLDMSVDMRCNSCGAESKVGLPMGASFFWPQ